jgi:aspartate aminotransferase-like enzyme
MSRHTNLPTGQFFLPGPTEVGDTVLQAQTNPMIGHRGGEIKTLIADLQVGLKEVFQTERPVLISTSSATGLMEAAVRNGVAGGTVLGLVNGAFSSRFAEIAASCGHDVDRWEVGAGDHHDPDQLAERLAAHHYQAVTFSHSETSTGVLQDLEGLAAVVGDFEGTLILVDSVTGVGGARVLTDEWGLDFVLTGSQKALALPPGLAFGVASPAMMERSAAASHKGHYFDLVSLMKSIEGNQTPNTPAVSLLYSAQTQLHRIREEGIESRWDRHAAMRSATEDWVVRMQDRGVEVGILAAEGHRSPTVTSITLPADRSGPQVVAAIKERGWVIGGGYGELSDRTVRIGHMGDHTVEKLEELLEDLEKVVG